MSSTTLEDTKRYAEELEADAEKSGWDQPACMFRIYFNFATGQTEHAVIPLQWIHPHPPQAIEILAGLLEHGAFPPHLWPRVGEFALIVIHESWQRTLAMEPQAYRDEYDAWLKEHPKEAGYSKEQDKFLISLRKKYHGTTWLSEIPGSLEVRMVNVLVGKHTYAYTRTRDESPHWYDSSESDMEMGGRLIDAMKRIQRASRVNNT